MRNYEKQKEAIRKYQQANRDKINERRRALRRERRLALGLPTRPYGKPTDPNYFKNYYHRNREKMLAASKKWREKNKEYMRAYLKAYRKRKKEEKNKIGTL